MLPTSAPAVRISPSPPGKTCIGPYAGNPGGCGPFTSRGGGEVESSVGLRPKPSTGFRKETWKVGELEGSKSLYVIGLI